jgi:hypothetical protein
MSAPVTAAAPAAGSAPLAEQHAMQQAPKKLNHLSGILFTTHSILGT